MALNFKSYNKKFVIIFACFIGNLALAQFDTSSIKAQFALGVNSPSSNGFVSDFEANGINFPTINLGVQYMFKPRFGAKLDFGYNRFSNKEGSLEFKTNYSRINAQVVYDASRFTSFLPRIGAFAHAGPGISMIKPLGNYGDNKTTFLNAMAGLEIHYAVTDKVSVYFDTSYIFGFGKDFDPVSDGFGSFNGDLLTFTIGASISLSGCYYCGN